jgi:hypothetical protein
MSLRDLPDDVRYGGVLAVVVALGLFASWRIVRAPVNEWYLFLVPVIGLVLAGVEWDRIYLHDKSL